MFFKRVGGEDTDSKIIITLDWLLNPVFNGEIKANISQDISNTIAMYIFFPIPITISILCLLLK